MGQKSLREFRAFIAESYGNGAGPELRRTTTAHDPNNASPNCAVRCQIYLPLRTSNAPSLRDRT